MKIVDAVKGRITIGFDSGIRCGADMYARPVSSYLSRLTCGATASKRWRWAQTSSKLVDQLFMAWLTTERKVCDMS